MTEQGRIIGADLVSFLQVLCEEDVEEWELLPEVYVSVVVQQVVPIVGTLWTYVKQFSDLPRTTVCTGNSNINKYSGFFLMEKTYRNVIQEFPHATIMFFNKFVHEHHIFFFPTKSARVLFIRNS